MACCERRLSLGVTESVCPTCLATVPAERYAQGDVVYLRKTCPEHGAVATPIWRGLDSYLRWDWRGAPIRAPPSAPLRSNGAVRTIAAYVPITGSRAAACCWK